MPDFLASNPTASDKNRVTLKCLRNNLGEVTNLLTDTIPAMIRRPKFDTILPCPPLSHHNKVNNICPVRPIVDGGQDTVDDGFWEVVPRALDLFAMKSLPAVRMITLRGCSFTSFDPNVSQ